MQNHSNFHGNHNIVIQGVSNSTITLNVDGKIEEIRNDLVALLHFLQNQQRERLQVGEKIYNINEIGQAIFQTILQQAPFLPPRFLGTRPFLPDLFIGRDHDLQNIHQILFEANNLLLLVNGQGGMGKTTLAARYYFQYQTHYSHLAWVFAEQSLLDALLTLTLPLRMDFPPTMPNPERLHVLLDALRELQKPCLLVIDNANRLEDLQDHYLALRSCPNFHLLLTTRITEFEHAQRYAIQPLQDHFPIELFKKHYPKHQDAENELLEQILVAVGHNTLVIELLAKNLHNFNRLKTQYHLRDLLHDLQTKGLLALQSKAVRTDYQAKDTLRQETPEAILSAMYDLSELNEAENQLLSVFAVLPAENIAFEILETLLPETKQLEESILALAQKGWLDFNGTQASFKCSPVIQEITRHKNREFLLTHCKDLLIALIKKLDYEPNIGHFLNTSFEEATLYAHYGENVVNRIDEIDIKLVNLFEYLGSYFTIRGNLDKALNFFKEFYNCAQLLFEANPESVSYKKMLAISFLKLGETYYYLGNLKQALYFFEHTKNLFEKLYSNDRANLDIKNRLSTSYLKLGEIHRDLKNLEQALYHFEENHKFKAELYPQDSNNVNFKNGLAISYAHLGSTCYNLGKIEQALTLFEHNYSLNKQLCEKFPKNPEFKLNFGWANQFLGMIHLSLGNFKNGLLFFKEMQNEFQKLCNVYPNDKNFKNGLATSYWKLGRFYRDHQKDKNKAASYFQQCYTLWEELATDYPSYAEFHRNFEWAKTALAELSEL